MAETPAVPLGFDIDAPQWDQSTFMGRLRHFLTITDPRTALVPERELDRAREVVASCRWTPPPLPDPPKKKQTPHRDAACIPSEMLGVLGSLLPSCGFGRAGLVPPGSSREQLLYAKKLYDSAFHPDSGEKMNLIGRMSFQVPGGMALTGCMLQFYR